MVSRKFLFRTFITSVIFGTSVINLALADDSLPKAVITDVALNDGGTLQGLVLDSNNNGMAGVPVTVRSMNHDVAQTTSSENGQFVVQDLRGGVYQVATVQSDNTFRLWAPRTAPPAAKSRAILFVRDNGASGNALKSVLGHPIILPALIATAIAVPIAVSSRHTPASP